MDGAGDLPVVEGGDEEEVVLVLGVRDVDPPLLHRELLPGAEEPEQLLHPVNVIAILVRDEAQVCQRGIGCYCLQSRPIGPNVVRQLG